jgi:hypothetical protein
MSEEKDAGELAEEAADGAEQLELPPMRRQLTPSNGTSAPPATSPTVGPAPTRPRRPKSSLIG